MIPLLHLIVNIDLHVPKFGTCQSWKQVLSLRIWYLFRHFQLVEHEIWIQMVGMLQNGIYYF